MPIDDNGCRNASAAVAVGSRPGRARWSRRGVIAVGAGALLLPGRAAAMWRQAEGTPSAGAGEWSFTDDAGTTVTLPERPTRIVADLNAAAALWDFGIRPVAVSGYTTGTDAAWGSIDRDTPVISTSAGAANPDVEKLLTLGADLFVTITWGNNDENPYEWSFPELAMYEQMRQIVPVVAISGTGRADQNAERFAELAALLGADLASPEIAAAKQAYEERADAFRALAVEKAELTTLFVYADGQAEYVAYPPIWADLAMFQAFGLNIITPKAPAGDYWEELSPEQAMTYQSDVLFQSARSGIFTLDELAAHPTYGRLPAVKAGQMGLWNQDFIQSYQGLTAALETIMATLQSAKDVTP